MKCKSCNEEWWAVSRRKKARFCPFCGTDTEAAGDEPAPAFAAEADMDAGVHLAADVPTYARIPSAAPPSWLPSAPSIVPPPLPALKPAALLAQVEPARDEPPMGVLTRADADRMPGPAVVVPHGYMCVGEYAFSYREDLQSIVMPDSAEVIAKFAFSMCRGIRNVVIPDGVAVIGEYAFYGCENLHSVTIPPSVEKIGRDAFRGCCGGGRLIIRCKKKSFAHEYALNAGVMHTFI